MAQHLNAKDIQERYNGDVGRSYLGGAFFRETLLMGGRFRRQIFSQARGSILDVACGSGENFPYYKHPGNTYTGIELSAYMLGEARKRAQQLGMNVDLRVMDAQALDFPDNYFDTVVSAMSTCTFPDPTAALHEMRRVCKPEGRILLFEHGRSTWGPIARWQDSVTPQNYEMAGCRANQDPIQVVKAAGLKIISAETRLLGVFHLITISPEVRL